MSLPMRQAAGFADAALRRVLEVIDRRRPVAQLNGLLAAGLVDSVLSANRLAGSRDGVAVLRRVRLQPAVWPRPRCSAATVAGRACTPSHAASSNVAGRWQVVALHIG